MIPDIQKHTHTHMHSMRKSQLKDHLGIDWECLPWPFSGCPLTPGGWPLNSSQSTLWLVLIWCSESPVFCSGSLLFHGWCNIWCHDDVLPHSSLPLSRGFCLSGVRCWMVCSKCSLWLKGPFLNQTLPTSTPSRSELCLESQSEWSTLSEGIGQWQGLGRTSLYAEETATVAFL